MPSAFGCATATASASNAAATAEMLAQGERLRQRNRQLLKQLALGQRAVHRAAATITLPPPSAVQRQPPAASSAVERGVGGDGPVTSTRAKHVQRPPPPPSSESGVDCASPALGSATRRLRTSPPPCEVDSRSIRKSLADAFADRSDDNDDGTRVGSQPQRRLSPSVEGAPSLNSSPPAPSAAAETPKSILKRRRIIDDNVPVESRLRHTPGWMERIGMRGADQQREPRSLAYASKPPQQPAEVAAARPRSVSFAHPAVAATTDVAGDDEAKAALSVKHFHPLPSRRPLAELATNAGNYRPSAVALAAETPRRALKCGLGAQNGRTVPGLTDDAADGAAGGRDARGGGDGGSRAASTAGGSAATASPYRGRGGSRLASPRVRDRSPSSRRGRSSAVAAAAAAAAAAVGERQHPLLGYDWIAALLENEQTPASVAAAAQLPDAFYEELRGFRRQNRDECVSHDEAAVAAARQPAKSPLLTPSKPMVDAQAGDLPSPSHTCIHNYTVNQRLFAVPTNADDSGRSRCPVCWRQRKSPTTTSPGFVRVSIPRATLMTPYKVRPHRRKSFDPSDSYALSKHCLAGWENQRPPPAVVARNVDLANETNRLKSKWTTTIKEAEELALKLKKLPHRSRDLDTTTLYTRQLQQIIEDLHNI